MTIDTIYVPKVSAINAQRTYSFTFESMGAESIFLSYLDAAGNSYSIAPSEYTLTLYGESPIYDGGQVVISSAPPSGMVEVEIARYTPRSQLVDYQPYTAFPAETQEFALDKLTMIAQETTVAEGGGTPVDPNAFVPVSGTRVGVPMTGTIESASNNQNYRLGIIGAGFDGYYLTDLKQNGLAKFVVSMDNNYTVFASDGQVLLSTVYDGSEDPSAAATVQYVIDAIGGPTAQFIPLTGTEVGAEVTGDIQFKNTALGITANFGILEGVTDVMSLYSDNNILVSTGPSQTNQWWAFGTNGQLNMPDIDYSLVDDLDAVTKGYVDAAVAGGGTPNVFLPLAGTDPSFPVTGLIEFENVALNRSFQMGISTLPGFDDGFTIASQGSSGNPSNIRLVANGVIYAFTPDAFIADEINVNGILTGGIINSGGATFGGSLSVSVGDLTLSNGDLNITGQLVLSEGIFCGQIIATNASISGAQSTAPGALVRYDTLSGYSPTTRQIIAGAGLTGGGNLTADRTINVGAGDGITVAADTVAVNTTVVRTTGAQTIGGQKLFSSALRSNVAIAGSGLSAEWLLNEIGYKSSDIKLKENVQDSTYGLEAVLQLRPRQFDWKSNGEHDTGFIAQEVNEVIPEATPYIEKDDMFGYKDTPIVSALVKAVQELSAKVDTLEAQLRKG